jgi:hypothetical protein
MTGQVGVIDAFARKGDEGKNLLAFAASDLRKVT